MLCQVSAVQRGSGSRLEWCVYKSGAHALAQVAKMQAAPATFAPVLAVGLQGYVMPVLSSLATVDHVQGALDCLSQYWYTGAHAASISRGDYQAYVLSCGAPPVLMEIAAALYLAAHGERGLPVHRLHGDATIENAMLHQGEPVWIDPSVRPVPLEAELDVAKMLQSAYGYGECPLGTEAVVFDLIENLELNYKLIKYYLATHLIRLWVHQPERHAWALAVAKVELC